jgi:hypothetical protein
VSYDQPSWAFSQRVVRAFATGVLVLVHVLAVDRFPLMLSVATLVLVEIVASARV